MLASSAVRTPLAALGVPPRLVDTLRRHAAYQGGLTPSHPVVKHLWQALRSFTVEERQLFLRFVWGRNRLPTSDGDWTQPFTVTAIAEAPGGGALDGMLPIAHTCFFALDLPLYSTYEILRSKLVYAIVNCQVRACGAARCVCVRIRLTG